MEFKQFISIVWQRKTIFFFVLFSIVFLTGVWYFAQPIKYKVVFSVDISRENYQETADFRYDQFYRLQADEKFSETIVRWVEDSTINKKIQEKYKGKNFSMEKLKAERLSPSYLRISFDTRSNKEFLETTKAIERVLKNKISEINKEANDPNWFSVIVNEPQISEQKLNFNLIILGAILLGVVLGIFASLFHYYWQANENRN